MFRFLHASNSSISDAPVRKLDTFQDVTISRLIEDVLLESKRDNGTVLMKGQRITILCLADLTAEEINSSIWLIDNCRIIAEDIYQKTLSLLETMEPIDISDSELDLHEYFKREVTVMDLPLSISPRDLCDQYLNNENRLLSPGIKKDIFKYNIPNGLDEISLMQVLDHTFFSLPIVDAVVRQLQHKPLFFGEMKAFLQDINETSPRPTRHDLTPYTQNLYFFTLINSS